MHASTHPRIGSIGLGLLGSALAERLLAHGHQLFGYDTRQDRVDEFNATGGTSLSSSREVFRRCECVVLSLPTSSDVSQVIREVEPELRPGLCVIDTTTGAPDEVLGIAKRLSRQDVHYLEATVAGSSQQVRTGRAVAFVAGDANAVERHDDVLQAIAPQRFFLGAAGRASSFKLVHNLILGLHRAVLGEGLAFAESLGFDAATALEILQQTPAASRVMQTKGAKMATQDYTPQARLSQHLKDVRLILDVSAKVSCPTPLSRLHQELLEHAETCGFGDADNSAIVEIFRNLPPDVFD